MLNQPAIVLIIVDQEDSGGGEWMMCVQKIWTKYSEARKFVQST